MSTQRIELPTGLETAEQSDDTPATLFLKIAAGTLVLFLSVAVILPYLVVMASYMFAAAGLHQVKVAGAAVYETVIYAGSVLTGR